jgi:hypothetical protein
MTLDEDLLARLSSHDVNPQRAERIRQRAHRVLGERARRRSHPIAVWLSSGYHRIVEPAALIALGLGYLAWTVQDTVALLH